MSTQEQASEPGFIRRVFLGGDGLVRPIWRVMVFVVLSFFLLVLATGAAQTLGPAMPGLIPGPVFYLVANAALLLEGWFLLSVLDRRSFRTLGLWFYPGWGRELLLGMAFGGGLIAAVVVILVATRAVSYHGFATLDARSLVRLWALAGLLFLAAAFEEILFRGYGFQRLVDSVGPFAAVAVISGLFGAAHILNPSATPLAVANTVLSGVILSVAYLKTRALWLPIGLHWAWNFSMGAIFSLPVSGLRLEPTLLRAEVSGATWLSGGGYGPEGSAALTVLGTAATLWLVRERRIAASAEVAKVLQ